MLLYRSLTTIFAAWMIARAVIARDWAALRQRLALEDAQAVPHVWLHAASNGELASAKPLIETIQRTRPGLRFLVTCNSESGVVAARKMGLDARLAPLDLGWTARRMHRNWNTCAHIAMEAELWPHRLLTCPGPVIVLGGRLTEGTAKGWGWLGGVQERVLARVAMLSAQDDGSLRRFLVAGLPKAAAGPVVDLKSFYETVGPPGPDLAAAFDRSRTWLASSTHEGEDAVVLDAHLEARSSEPGLRLILVPRHPRRADDIARMIENRGLIYTRRSKGEPPEAEVYLADTLGEMGQLYQLAGRVFVAGSLTDRGGHTPYEPAAYGAALIHGPDVRNFRASYGRLDVTGAALCIQDASQLAAALSALSAAHVQREKGEDARNILRPSTELSDFAEQVLAILPAGCDH